MTQMKIGRDWLRSLSMLGWAMKRNQRTQMAKVKGSLRCFVVQMMLSRRNLLLLVLTSRRQRGA